MTALVDRALAAFLGLGSELAVAVSVVLAVGALCTALLRSPHERHRTAELCLAGALLVVVLLVVPLPRPLAGSKATPDVISAESLRGGSESLAAEVGTVPLFDLRAAATPSEAGAEAAAPGRLEPAAPAAEIVPAELRAEFRGGDTPGEHSERRAATTAYTAWERLALVALLVALGFALRSALSIASLTHLLGSAREAPDWLRARADRLGVGARVVVSSEVSRPCCAGFLRGTIVLPSSLALPSKGAQLEAVLLHEDAHAAQRHPRARVLAALATPFLYWNPLFWWLVRDLRQSAELVADDMAAGRWDKRCYVTELLRLVEAQTARRAPAPLGSGALESRSEFLERMEALLMRRLPLNTKSSRSLVAVRSMGALCVLASVAAAWGRPVQDAAPEPAQPERAGVLDALIAVQQAAPQTPAGGGVLGALVADPGMKNDLRDALGVLNTLQQADPRIDVVRAEPRVLESLAALSGLGYLGAGDTQPEPAPNPVLQAPARHDLEFEFVVEDHAALGRLVVKIAASGFPLEFRSELDVGAGGSPIRGRARIRGVSTSELSSLFGQARIESVQVETPRSQPAPKPEPNPLAERVAKLEALVAKLAVAETSPSGQEGYDINALARDTGAAYERYYRALAAPRPSVDTAPELHEIYVGIVSNVTRGRDATLIRIDCTGPPRWKEGEHLEIHRGDRYLGRVRVVDAQDGRTLGILVMEAEGASIGTGDRALYLVPHEAKDKAKSKAEYPFNDVIGIGGGAGGDYREQ